MEKTEKEKVLSMYAQGDHKGAGVYVTTKLAKTKSQSVGKRGGLMNIFQVAHLEGLHMWLELFKTYVCTFCADCMSKSML